MERRQTDAERVLDEIRLEAGAALTFATQPPASRIAAAAFVWLSAVFGLCHVGLPLVGWGLGVHPGPQLLWVAGSAWAAAAVVVLNGLLTAQPTLQPDGRRDPVLAATAGGLVVWAAAQALVSALRPFGDFALVELGWFVAQNLVECGLLGLVWASLTRRPALAFSLGAGFQILVAGIIATIAAL